MDRIRQLDNPPPTEIVIEESRETTDCFISDLGFYSESSQLNSLISELVINKGKRQDIKEIAAKALLYQSLLRPALSSPSARIQIVGKIKNKNIYKDFIPIDKNSLPMLPALNWLVKSPSRTVSSVLASLTNPKALKFMKVEAELATFIEQNSNQIKNDSIKRSILKIGSDYLIKGETLRYTPKLLASIKTLLNSRFENKINIEEKIYAYRSKLLGEVQCNQNLKLFDEALYFNLPQSKTLHFTLADSRDHLMVVVSQNINTAQNIPNTPYFRGNKFARPSTICQSQNGSYIISESTDPGQLMHNFLNQEFDSDNRETLKNYIDKSRYLLIFDPTRILFESKNAEQSLLNRLLRMDIPIMHRKKIGKLWITQSDQKTRVYLDGRYKSYGICPNN